MIKILFRQIKNCGECPFCKPSKNLFVCEEIGHGGRNIKCNVFKEVERWCPLPEMKENFEIVGFLDRGLILSEKRNEGE